MYTLRIGDFFSLGIFCLIKTTIMGLSLNTLQQQNSIWIVVSRNILPEISTRSMVHRNIEIREVRWQLGLAK